MTWQQRGSANPPHPNGTFSPGLDGFYMPAPPPDVVSPAPQRITPEVPSNIQDSLAHMEINGRAAPSRSPALSQYGGQYQNSYNQRPQQATNGDPDEPNYSYFPKLRSRSQNIPPSLEEREASLENARLHVLSSADPEMQLEWAQDALQYIDVCVEQRKRLGIVQSVPPVATTVQNQLQSDAVNITMFLADQRHPKAEFLKGMWLEFGKFTFAQDKPEAFRSYKRAAHNGYARAEYRMGVQFESTGESIKALQHYKAGEVLGDSASCYRMGMMSLTGQLGQTQDFNNAIRLIRQAADTADGNAPQGAYVLGMLLARELSEIKVPDHVLPMDLDAARMYLEKAAYLGFAKAQLKMGTAYEMCMLGCEFDPALSMHYNALAAQQGEPEAEMAISKWFLCGHEGMFRKNEELAFKFAQRAAASGLTTAQFALGYFYEIGIQVQRNVSVAVEWYEKAAHNGSTDAQGRLDAISKSQTMSRKDHENITVTRIKSQYGSRRGGRPQRFANAPQPMPTIQDGPGNTNPPYQQSPPLGGRTTPYPIDDPYATKARPTLTANDYPNQRPSSSMSNARYDQQGRPLPQSGPMLGPPATYRPVPPERPNTVTGQTSARPSYNAGPGPSSNPGPASKPLQPPQSVPPQQYQRPPAPRIDIGFSAPVDTRADQRNRPQTNLHPPPHRQYPNRVSSSQQQQPQQQQQQQATLAPASPVPARPSSAGPRPSSSSSSSTQYVMSGALPSSAASKPSAASAQKPSTKPATSVVPPKSGPQTFQEMGVPASKKDHDCIVM